MFEVLYEACKPKRGTRYSAYVDLFSREDVVIGAGETKIVPLGVKIDLDNLYDSLKNDEPELVQGDYRAYLWEQFMKSHYLEVALRSSLGVKGLIISNGIGIIDLDFTSEIKLIVHNPIGLVDYNVHTNVIMEYGIRNSDGYSKSVKIAKGEKVAQCTLKEHKGYLMGYESDVVCDGGFGSTGDKA